MEFKTLKKSSEAEFKEKGSKFIGYAFPIKKKEDVSSIVANLKIEHPKANHVCTAFLIKNKEAEYYLVNDDGEPSNSAGMPILGQINSFLLKNVLIAVVRYFGGTKLGVGGLISAYKHAAKLAIENNKIVTVHSTTSLSANVNYQDLGRVLSILDRNQIDCKQIPHDGYIQIILECKLMETQKLIKMLLPLQIEFKEIQD